MGFASNLFMESVVAHPSTGPTLPEDTRIRAIAGRSASKTRWRKVRFLAQSERSLKELLPKSGTGTLAPQQSTPSTIVSK
jgi:hypothetical protein